MIFGSFKIDSRDATFACEDGFPMRTVIVTPRTKERRPGPLSFGRLSGVISFSRTFKALVGESPSKWGTASRR
jgi:hypothetical protein